MISCYDPQNRQEDDAANLLSTLVREIQQQIEALGNHLERACVAIPVYTTGVGRRCIWDAFREADFPLESMIGELPMAVIPYCCGKTIAKENVLVFHLGAHSMDTAMIRVQNIQTIPASEDSIQIHQSCHNHGFGGVNWTEEIQRILSDAIYEVTGCETEDLSDCEYAQLLRQAEQIKIQLSEQESVTTTLTLQSGSIPIVITRAQFESVTAHLLQDVAQCVDTILGKAGVSPDAVVLSGGGCHMPMIRRMLENRFPGKIHCHQPELQIARGAALYSYILSKKPLSENS